MSGSFDIKFNNWRELRMDVDSRLFQCDYAINVAEQGVEIVATSFNTHHKVMPLSLHKHCVNLLRLQVQRMNDAVVHVSKYEPGLRYWYIPATEEVWASTRNEEKNPLIMEVSWVEYEELRKAEFANLTPPQPNPPTGKPSCQITKLNH